MITVTYEGIDRMNRPVFKNVKSKSRYGSLNILFPYCESEDEVLKKVYARDLVFFGNKFDCEPMGDEPIEPIYIERE